MSWHEIPKDGAWREVNLAYLAANGTRLWLRCNSCGHEVRSDPETFAIAHKLAPETPLLLIARRLVCAHCGERKAHAWPEPYAGVERPE